MRKFIYGLVGIFAISSLIFTSCDNFNGSNILEPICANNSESASTETSASKADRLSGKTGYVTLSGSINMGGAVPKEIAQAMQISNTENDEISSRSAFPSIPTTGITYSVTAVNTATGSTESYTGEVLTDDGNVTYRVGIPATETEKNYKVKVSVRLSGFEREYVILSGQSDEFSISSDKPVESKNITLKPESNNGSGILNLSVDVTGTEIKSAVATVNFSSNERAYIYGVLNDNQLIFKTGEHTDDELADGLSSGAWSVIFEFYKTTNRTGEKVYSFNEIVSIFENLTTDTWVQNGDEPRFVTTTDASGKKTTICRITSAMLERDKLTDIYVDSSRSTTSGAANYTTETGTFINPCTSFSKAIEKLTDATKDYTIYINGTLSGSGFQIPASLKNDGSGTYNAKSLTLCGARGLNTNGVPKDAIDGGTDSPVLIIRSDISVTIKNLLITNGISGDQGVPGGILIDANDVTLSDGALVKNNLSDELDSMGATSGSFKIKGSAYIPAGFDGTKGKGKNDVGLSTGETIKIAGKLTPPAACTDGIVATITPASYTAGTQLIELDTGVTDTSLAEAAAHFAVTPDASNPSKNWAVDREGKLNIKLIGTKAGPDTVGDIVFNDGSAMPYADFAALATDDERNALKPYAIALIFYKGTELNSDADNGSSDTTTVRTLGIGLKYKRVGLAWCTTSAQAYNNEITTIKCPLSGEAGALTFTGDKNGSDNLEQIAAFLDASNDTGVGLNSTKTEEEAAELYPAFYFAKNYKNEIIGSEDTSRIPAGSEFETGWYLPSIAELFQIYAKGMGADKVIDLNAAILALGGDGLETCWYLTSNQFTENQIYQLALSDGSWNYQVKEMNNFSAACCIRAF